MEKKDLKWETLKSSYIIQDRWATVRKDQCRTSDGKIIDPYYVYEFPDWVTAFALTKEGKVIMEVQYRHALGEIHYEIPGGCVEKEDADLEVSIRRELREETGYVFDHLEPLGVTSANPSTDNNRMYMFLATGGELVGDQDLDYNEELLIELKSIEEVKEMLKKDQIIQSMHQVCIFRALEKIGQLHF